MTTALTVGTTALDTVLAHYRFPFPFRPYQVFTVNTLAPRPRAGYYLDQGTGKTACSTAAALYKLLTGADAVIVLMPPILLAGWSRWLAKIEPAPTTLVYRGTPKQRAKLAPAAHQFALMTIQIFKRDQERLLHDYRGKRVVLLVDEATSIKNVATANYKTTQAFLGVMGADLLALTGTPMSTPMDAYGLTKLIAPSLYRNLHQFEKIHVAERDYFDKVVAWQNLDLLAKNMRVNAVRVLRQDVLPDLPPVLMDPVYYELDPAHYTLYQRLAEEKLLELENGGKIDATTEGALYHALQQVVLNYDHYSGNPANRAAAFALIDQVMDDLDVRDVRLDAAGAKLVIFADYRMSNALLARELAPKYGAVAVYGDISPTQQRKNLDRFMADPTCRIAILQPTSAGYGVDGLQEVCSDILFLELPAVPRDFHQAVARIWRDGLKHKCHVRLALAEGTVQPPRLRSLMTKDELVGKVMPNFKDLRDMVFGRARR